MKSSYKIQAEAENKFQNWLMKLADFSDKNKNITSQRARMEQRNLQNEYGLAFELCQGLAQQLEQTKLEMKKETPIFTTLNPIVVRIKKSEPKRGMIILTFCFLGLFLSLGYVLTTRVLKKLFVERYLLKVED